MKKFFTLFGIVLFMTSSFAQVPQKMSYQAVIRNSSNQLITNHPVGMRISILQGNVTGLQVFTEEITPETNATGLISIEIGGTGFDLIDWSNGPYFIKTETDPLGGTDYTITGTTQLLSVPYAFYSNTSGSSSDAVKLTGDQTISGNKTFTGIISANNQTITNVASPINSSDAVNKEFVTLRVSTTGDTLYLGNGQHVIIWGISQANQVTTLSTITDAEGNVYKTVTIGNQEWMAEDLKTTKYNDSTDIHYVPVDSAWYSDTMGAYCWYNNDTIFSQVYGGIYNWYAVNTAKLCPSGWHVPSDSEWSTLIEYLGGDGIAGGKLKKIDTGLWFSPNIGADNSSGFSAIPGGYRNGNGSFTSLGLRAIFWSSSIDEVTEFAWFWDLSYDNNSILRNKCSREGGFSVRCLKD